MDSFHATEFKFGKPNVFGKLKRLGNVFRAVEIFVFLVMVWRISFEVRFPVGECMKRFLSVLLSHRSVFVIGNVIVITLFAKSGRDSAAHQNTELDLHLQKPRNVEKQSRANEGGSTGAGTEHTVSVPDSIDLERCTSARIDRHSVGVISDDKFVEKEKHALKRRSTETGIEYTVSVPDTIDLERCISARVDQQSVGVKSENKFVEHGKHAFKRSYSDCLEVESHVKPRRILRRTVTEGGRDDAAEGGGDGMSDEEFRVMVETFIAKQQRSLREEEEKCLSYF